MTPILNLHILAEKFTQLSNAIFFDRSFREFAQKTASATLHVIANCDKYDSAIVRSFEAQLWRVLQFISGSRSSDAPHEVQFTLRKALKEWSNEDALVASASLSELNFFLDPLNLWNFIATSLHLFDADGYNKPVVRIASPEAYKNKPIFCIPLFHELGHYIDFHYQITDATILLDPPNNAPPGVNVAAFRQLHINHRREYFADLFAACYCGETTNKSLLAIAPSNPASHSHPATVDRVRVVQDFLAGINNPEIARIKAALNALKLPELKVRFSLPDVAAAFDDVLVYRIQNDAELFGIFNASWDYLEKQVHTPVAPWASGGISQPEIEKTVNDLTEKSIRNYEIRERWAVGTSDEI